ncbi:MAG: TatD family hydrolase [bacterium]|nr:TatD family hydrolase [bacterium]
MNLIIDIHTHIFPDHGAAKIIAALEAEAKCKAFTDGTRQGLLDSMQRSGVQVCVQVPVATRADQVENINSYAIKVTDHRIVSFGTLHPKYPHYKKEISRLKASGIKGVKFHPEYQDFFPDDEAMFPVYEELSKARLTAFFHAGRDIAFANVHGTPAHFARLIKAFPNLKLVLAHMGGFQMWEEVLEEIIGKDVYIDTSFCMDYMSRHAFLRLVERHDPDLILFGTDSPWQDQKQELAKLRTLITDDTDLQKIISLNASTLLDL